MTIRAMYRVECNWPGCSAHTEYDQPTSVDAITDAERYGWIEAYPWYPASIERAHICPEHVEAFKRNGRKLPPKHHEE